MTTIELYEALQFDLNKLEAPSILLDEFNHFVNKAINQYVNKRYNLADSKQQLTDDLQGIYNTLIITCDGKIMDRTGKIIGSTNVIKTELGILINLPLDYLHMLGAIVSFNDSCNTVKAARRLTADIYGGIQDNSYLKPSLERPYFYIIGDTVEIRCGQAVDQIEKITIDYLKSPEKVKLLDSELNYYLETQSDKSTKLEFREYINYEILKELVSLVLEMTSDPRLQTNIPITQSIN